MKPKVIAIVGPTASGKSSLGLLLAQKFGGEIISADSRQIYKGMEVISRAPTKKELEATPHYLVSTLNPKKSFSAGDYKVEAEKIVQKILKKKSLPIVVGGTGFYADSLLRGLTLPEVAPDPKLRQQLLKKSSKQLLAILKKLDPKSAKRVDPHNLVRIIRAIEIAQAIGPIPSLSYEEPYETLWLGLLPEKNLHQKAMKKGVEDRLKAGMIAEIKKLRTTLSKKRFLELGFEFALVADYLEKKISKKELVDLLVRGEEKYAKRQMRWFLRNRDIKWVKNKAEALRLAKGFLSR
jgi:tRNA dimethylallyltransferase